MHESIKLESPIEFINITPLNPLISKCQIKVCYVSDKPNRNKSIITKDVATKIANSLPGSPIVGFYNEEKGDFEGHNRMIDISNGEFKIKDTTRPYGFVDLGAKVWFQKFLDDGQDEREYLMTEGWLWTGQYPECKRIIDKGNNQSMELDENILNAHWTKDENGKRQFFIINEAIISKLCTLGEEVEPCFEGANITAPNIQFSLDEDFKNTLYSMMVELKELLNKGGEKMFTKYAVEIGDSLWTALFDYAGEKYSIDGVYEDGEQKFAVLKEEDNYYRLNFSVSEDGSIELEEEVSEMSEYTPAEEPQFDAAAVEEYAKSKEKKDEEEPKKDSDTSEDEDTDKKCPKCGKSKDECTCDDEEDDDEKNQEKKDKKGKYNLDEVQEYVELNEKYSKLETEYNTALERISELEKTNSELTSFKKGVEKIEKQKLIDSFYMLSDNDKADVVENIDTYSLEDIEAKLSIICVRNKVSFNLEDDKKEDPTTFNLNGGLTGDESVPAWIKALRSVAKEM